MACVVGSKWHESDRQRRELLASGMVLHDGIHVYNPLTSLFSYADTTHTILAIIT